MTAYNVSSFFLQETASKKPTIIRRMFIGPDSDYSERVVRWPSIRRKWNDIRPVNLTISLANEDQNLNFFRDNPALLNSQVSIRAGIIHPGENFLTRSEAFDVDSWSQINVDSLDPNFVVGPNLTRTSDEVTFANVQSGALVQNVAVNLLPDTEYNFSIYMQLKNLAIASAQQVQLVFDGDVLSPGLFEIGDQVDSGFLRFDITNTTSGGGTVTTANVGIRTESYIGALDLWGAQINSGNAVGEYIRADATIIPRNSEELVTFYAGAVDKVGYNRGQCNLTLADKLKPFTEIILGSSDVPLDFTGSDYLPSDLVFFLVTSEGGFSAVQSDSNPDIDWLSFLEWAEVFSRDNVLVQARFTGQKINEALRKIGRYTYSAIFVENDLLTFARFTVPSSLNTTITDDAIINRELDLVDAEVVNQQHVYADFQVSTPVWAIDAIATDSASVNSFGLREEVEFDKNIWYVNSDSSLNLAQRRVSVLATPFDRFKLTTPLVGFARQIGEMISFTDSFFDISVTSGEVFRLMEYTLNLDNGQMVLSIDPSQVRSPFILDDPIFGLLDQDYNFLL